MLVVGPCEEVRPAHAAPRRSNTNSGFPLGFRLYHRPSFGLHVAPPITYSPLSEGEQVEVERPRRWKTWLASITGTVDRELLLHNESLATENSRRSQIRGRLRLVDGERKALAEMGQLGKHALAGNRHDRQARHHARLALQCAWRRSVTGPRKRRLAAP